MTELRKWIEYINDAYPMDIKNIWYEGGNEYGPEGKEAGCYYNILPSAKNSMIEVWCGSWLDCTNNVVFRDDMMFPITQIYQNCLVLFGN